MSWSPSPPTTATSGTINENWVMEMNITVSFTHNPQEAFSKELIYHLLCFLAIEGMCRSLQSEKKISKESVFQQYFFLDCSIFAFIHNSRKDLYLFLSTKCSCTSSICSGTSLPPFPEIDSVYRFQDWNCPQLTCVDRKTKFLTVSRSSLLTLIWDLLHFQK